MGVIAKGEITLSTVNDAYTVSLSKTSCVVNADYDGSNPKLDEAYTTITVKRGDKPQWFKVKLISTTNDGIVIRNVSMPSGGDENTLFKECVFLFDSVPTDILEGSATIQISTEDGYVADVVFSYTVVRESTMLDWIQDWEGNKTQIGGTSIITPKLFVGKKITNGENYDSIFNVPQLTGVYIGPAGENGNSCGVYGYKAGEEIFHLDDTGGYIGGWTINTGGIYSAKGALRLLSNGTIKAVNSEGDSIWEIREDGDAFFAFENVKFYKNGDAEFAGTIKSKDGQIGGWTLNDYNLYTTQIGINSGNKYIAIANISSIPLDNGNWDGNHFAWVKSYGGVAMYYSHNTDYGFVAYNGSAKVFSAGYVNLIAGWNFDKDSIWSGTKNNTLGAFTTGGITIGSNGIRGIKWYIDSNGDISFMNGMIKFTASSNGGEIVGWKLNSQRFSTNNVALVSDSSNTGLYLSASSEASFNTRASSSLKGFIVSKGGVYLNVASNNAVFGAYNSSGGKIFLLQSNGVNSIAGWNFDKDVLYIGTKATSGFTASGSITLGPTGLRGYKWRFENNGSGAIAGGNISWDASGNVTFASSVKIGWDNLGGTIINSEGVFAGKISADNITAGTISTANIKNQSNTWYLNQDGSGALANGNITWDKSGNVTVNGKIIATSGSIGGFEIGSNRIGSTATASGSGGYLAIYNDFLRVGASYGYVMFGDDVIPASSGGVFTATGRIVNQKQNTMGSYGFDQANYGLLINVSGGTKNYGIESNAALKAPAFINTKAKLLTFTGNGYTVDFSQYNVLLLYYNDANYSKVEVTLPSESSVSRQFGLSSLPSDFAAIVTFRVRPGSKNIILKGIYNHNESSQDYILASGDSIIVLITKVDGFRYQILNHSS